MRVRVLFFGALKEIAGRAEETVEVPAGATLEDVFAIYSERFETLRERRSSTLFARNREFAPGDTQLTEDDEIAFLPPVSGGSGDGHVFGITRERIDARKLAEALQ